MFYWLTFNHKEIIQLNHWVYYRHGFSDLLFCYCASVYDGVCRRWTVWITRLRSEHFHSTQTWTAGLVHTSVKTCTSYVRETCSLLLVSDFPADTLTFISVSIFFIEPGELTVQHRPSGSLWRVRSAPIWSPVIAAQCILGIFCSTSRRLALMSHKHRQQ